MFDLVAEEGLMLGGSTGINIARRDQGGASSSGPATPS